MRTVSTTRHLLIVASVLLFVSLKISADDWPNWRGPNHDGVSDETDWSGTWPEQGPEILWKANVGTGFSSVSVVGDQLLTIGNLAGTESVFCLRADNGGQLWKFSYECPLDPNLFEGGPTSSPTIDGDRVYTMSRIGQLFCFDVKDGTVLWSIDFGEDPENRVPGWGFGGSPVVVGDSLILNMGSAGLAVDKQTGKPVWASEPGDPGYSTPLPFMHEGTEYVVLSSSKYYLAVDANTGEELWRHRWITRFGINASDPLIHGEHVLISTGYRKGATLLKWSEPDEPLVMWKEKTMNNQINSSVLIDGYVYGIDGDTNSKETTLKCIDYETGEEQWAHPGIGSGSLMAADAKLIVLSATGELLIASASRESFEPTAKAQVLQGKCWTVPVLANGRIYCRNASGDLVCVDVRVEN